MYLCAAISFVTDASVSHDTLVAPITRLLRVYAYIFLYEMMIVWLLNQCTCHNEKNVSVRMMGLCKGVDNIFWNSLIPILIPIVPRQVMYGFDWRIRIHLRQLQANI